MRSVFLVVLFSVLSACSINAPNMPLNQSPQYYDYIQPSFEAYQQVTYDWLKTHRRFITDDTAKELAMNAPYALGDKSSEKAILLVHGLADSPYSFSDIAPSLVEMGFYVEVLLLPGHGSKPEDMMLPTYQDWQTIVDHYAAKLSEQYDTVWLGGFSTRANLVTHHAIGDASIDGLLLFSPGFRSKVPVLERLSPLVASVRDWGWRGEENNLARYQSSATNGANAYVKSAIAVREQIKQHGVSVPALVVMSEDDSVIDAQSTFELMDTYFTHPSTSMVWYGDESPKNDSVLVFPASIPEQRIVSASHMSVLFSEKNTYYGRFGEKRYCENTVSKSKVEACESAESVWYGAWGAQHEDDPVARLTWNPHYGELEQTIRQITQQ